MKLKKRPQFKIANFNLMIFSCILLLTFSCTIESDLFENLVEDEVAEEPVEEVTITSNGNVEVEEDKSLSINIDDPLDKQTRRLKSVGSAKNGRVTLKNNKTIILTPDDDFNGVDSFEYVVEITEEDETVIEETVSVEVKVTPVKDVVNDSIPFSTNPIKIDVLKNDTFKDISQVTISKTSSPKEGEIELNDDNTITYTPNSGESKEDSFTYTAKITHSDDSSTVEEGIVAIAASNDDGEEEEEEEEGGGDDDDNTGGDDTVSSTLKSFPEAEGFGRFATGGRGGKVIKVTNLNDSGAGSFREAVEASGPRIVVFEVGGTIELDYNNQLRVRNGDLTIAGQSAPANSGGITIKGAIRFNYTENIIIRNVRFRLGDNGWKGANGNVVGTKPSGISYDGLEFLKVNNVIVDHCSVSWGVDETLSIVDCSDFTIQNTLISEGLQRSVHYESPSHSMGVLINRSDDITFYNNYVAHCDERNIRTARSTVEIINNVFYGFSGAGGFSSGQDWTAIGNHWKKAPGTSVSASTITSYISDSGWGHSGQIYQSDNTTDAGIVFLDKRWDPYVSGSKPLDSGINPKPLSESINHVLDNVGMRYPYFDSVDQRVVNNYRNSTGGIIDTPAQVGGYPSLSRGDAKTDSDGDGMPDEWEELMGLNPNVADQNGDLDDDGYTNLEEYLNIVANS